MTRCGLPLHDDKPALLPSAQHGAELALLRGTGTGVTQWRYPDCPERKGPYGTDVYTSAGAERLTGLRFETAGENLQNDVVLMMRPRGRLQAFMRFTLDPVETYYYPSFF